MKADGASNAPWVPLCPTTRTALPMYATRPSKPAPTLQFWRCAKLECPAEDYLLLMHRKLRLCRGNYAAHYLRKYAGRT